jgi:hypothetical protein
MKVDNAFPKGWDEQRVRNVLDFYEAQSDDEAASEHGAALGGSAPTVMEVPAELVPVVRQLIAEHDRERAPAEPGPDASGPAAPPAR